MGTARITRRSLVGMAPALAAAQRPAPEIYYEGESPTVAIVALDDRRLLGTVKGPAGILSTDAGKTWGQPVPFLQNGKPLDGDPHALLRLRDGRLGMIYRRNHYVETPSYRTRCISVYFAVSGDEGRAWSAGTPVDMPLPASDYERGVSMHHPFGPLLQLRGGRLLYTAYWKIAGCTPEITQLIVDGKTRDAPSYGRVRGRRISRIDGHMFEAANGGCFACYSDDLGKTWKRSAGSSMVWPLPSEGGAGGFGATFEPVAIERKDGRVLMFMRTNVGLIFQSVSEDGGDHWSLPTPTELASGDVPCWLGRVPSTGDLLAIWNQTTPEEVRRGYSRCRLSIATSPNDGRRWENFRTVDQGQGIPRLSRVKTPEVRHVRAEYDVGDLPDGFAFYHYPRLAFVQGKVILAYNTSRFDQGETRWHPKLKVTPEQWLYP